MNMFERIRNLANFTGVPVTSIGDVPSLVISLEHFGKFSSAQRLSDWYNDMLEKIHAEYTAPKATQDGITV